MAFRLTQEGRFSGTCRPRLRHLVAEVALAVPPLVRPKGFEPPRVTPLGPKPSASTSSATAASPRHYRVTDGVVPLQYTLPSIQAAAFSFAVQVNAAPVHAKDEIEGVIAPQQRDPGGGLIVMPDVFNDVNRELIIALAARYSMPAIYFNRFFTEPGGLISYGDVRSEQFRLAAGYIDRILKGEKPADLPLQVPTK